MISRTIYYSSHLFQKIKLKEAEERAKKQRKQEEQDERLAESLQADELRKFGSRDPDNSTTVCSIFCAIHISAFRHPNLTEIVCFSRCGQT